MVDNTIPARTTPGARGWVEAFSRPQAKTTKPRKDSMTQRNDHIPEGFQDLLQSTAVAHVATIGPEGGSQIMLVQKLRRDPERALSTVDPENDRPGDERVVLVRPRHTTHKDG